MFDVVGICGKKAAKKAKPSWKRRKTNRGPKHKPAGRPSVLVGEVHHPLSFNTLRVVNARRCGNAFHPIESWSPTDWATALGGEVGEALNIVKKLRRLGSDPQAVFVMGKPGDWKQYQRFTDDLADELGDMLIYADLLAARMGIDLGAAVRRKFNQVSEEVGSIDRL